MKLISIRKMKKRINVPANVKMGENLCYMVVLYSSASCQYTYPCTIRQNYIATEERDCRGGLD